MGHGGVEVGLAGFELVFILLAQAAEAAQPGEGLTRPAKLVSRMNKGVRLLAIGPAV